MKQFQVKKKKFVDGEIGALSIPELQEGDVLIKVDKFAYTANNVTYAVAGDMIGYWQFFPATGNRDIAEWGVIPVWGFADVVESNHEEVPIGDRLFGYFPPASHVVMRPAKVSEHQWLDSSEHRSSLPPAYNMYRRVANEPGYNKAFDNARMIFWPLHMTAFCIVDALQMHQWRGADQIIILSASSKTSLGLAIGLNDMSEGPAAIGITSSKNLQTTKELGVYDQLHTYDDLSEIDMTKPAVIVDMSGRTSTVNSLIDSMGNHLKYVIRVGLTHWGEAGQEPNISKDKSEFFFAPGHMQVRIKEWGGATFTKKVGAYIQNSVAKISQWMSYEKIEGLDGLMAVHKDVCLGNIPANKGLVVEM